MITLTVIAFNDAPADGTLRVGFDELGGTIGRAETNQLVLPDPERTVSRVAAQVVFRNGAFAVVERGSNPITLNGHALVSGREAPLRPGDRLRICGYELSVESGGTVAAAASDPFASLLGPAAAAPSAGRPLVDPLSRPGFRSAPATPAASARQGGIPVDWDPFAAPPSGAGRAGAPPPPRRDALGLDIGAAATAALIPGLAPSPAAQSSLDQLFGLAPSSGGDPLADSFLDAPIAQPNMSADADPLRSLKSAPRASAPTEADQLSDLQHPFIPPTVIKRARPAPAPASAAAPVVPARTEVRSPPTAAAPPATVTAPARRAPPAADDHAALLAAFYRGLDAPSLELPALTPALMEAIGQLLHESVRGTLALMSARAAARPGPRGEARTSAARSDNPLRFSPSAEVALRHLLAPPGRGFVAAAPAMREAYDELRREQFALVAGLQAVLDASLQRFDPAVLESQLGDRSLLKSLLPASRNARLWEAYSGQYARVRSEASGELRKLFGRAFMAAYDEHLGRAQQPAGQGRPGAAR